jgi:hypothetical protein
MTQVGAYGEGPLRGRPPISEPGKVRAMKVDWEFAAQTYLDQLPLQEQGRVAHAVEELSANWDEQKLTNLSRMFVSGANPQMELYVLPVGRDLRVVLRQQGDAIIIVDVIKLRQIEGLRKLFEAASG